MKTLILGIAVLLGSYLSAQTTIDTAFNFQTDPNKKVSIYIPSTYSQGTNNALMLALHPWNTNRWNGQSWRDTLIAFAEQNNLILLCPDGGSDGQIDDKIDQDFSTAMIDTIIKWYSIDTKRIYCMGFSWGGKTTYLYGLSKPRTFCGYIPIGAAIDVREVALVSDSAKNKPIYIIHGGNDAPSTRYTPLKNAMEVNGGIVNSILLPGVGHTIDFPNRNQIMTTGFKWVDSVCVNFSSVPIDTNSTSNSVDGYNADLKFDIYPNPMQKGQQFVIETHSVDRLKVSLFNSNGMLLWEKEINERSEIKAPPFSGSYILMIENGKESRSTQVFVK